jgi:hypothetical protein
MKTPLSLAAACLVAAFTQAAPVPSGHWQLRVTIKPYADLGKTAGSMYNPRFCDGYNYANEIGDAAHACFGRYPRGSSMLLAGVVPATEHRMVTSFRSAYSSTYMLASGGAASTTLTRYDFNGNNPQAVDFVDTQRVESFDWVDDNTIICNDYTSGNRRRLYLATVVAEPFSVSRNTLWNADGYITSAATTRIRNVRLGEMYSGYAYYGDNGVSVNPKVFALNLATGVETEVGSWNGTLKAGVAGGAATDSWGLWTVVERGGYLYLQSSDDGIQVYSMTGPTTMGSLYTSYSKAELDAATGGTPAYYGFDVAPNGLGLLLGGYTGGVYEFQERGAPIASGQWQHSLTVRPFADNPPQLGNSTYNPRYFDGNIYTTQLADAAYRCFAYYSGSGTFLGGGIPFGNEHRMLGRVRGAGSVTYLMGTGGWYGDTPSTFSPTFTLYDASGNYLNEANSIDNQVVETFDWVDDNTMISTCYISGQRKKLYLTDVVADPFALTKNTTWNANGYVENTALVSRIRNVRVGQVYSGYAYYGDAGNDSNPNFYAIDLATGVSTLLGNAGTLSHVGLSFGLWTVVELGGYLYVQTTDNGIQVYKMTDATTLGPLYTTYTKAELDAATGIAPTDQYYGMDLSPDGTKMLLGAPFGSVYELAPAFRLGLSRSGTDVILSWPAAYTGVVVQSSSDLSLGVTDMSPQPIVVRSGNFNTATIPVSGAQYFRLRK